MKLWRLSLFLLLAPVWLSGQVLNNASLNGKFYFVHLLAEFSPSAVTTNAHNLSGTITFDGNGGFALNGRTGSGAGAPIPAFANGTYSVSPNGFVTLDNEIAPLLDINARLGGAMEVLLGSSTEATDGSVDLFVAVRAPTGNVNNSVLNGNYTGGVLGFPNGSDADLTSVLLAFTSNGAGAFTSASTIGHAVDINDVNRAENLTNVTYAINGDGTGTADFGSSGTLLFGTHDVFVSANGNYLLGSSNMNGGRQIFLAIKNFSSSATTASWNGDYWIADLTTDPGNNGYFSSATGAVRADGKGLVSLSQRTNANRFVFDFSGINFYLIDPNSRGFLSPSIGANSTTVNFAIGAPSGGSPSAFVGAQVGTANQTTPLHGIFFGVRMPALTGAGVFLNPLGVINGASFAMPTFPITGGAIVSLFGSGLAPPGTDASAGSIPLPTTLAGVSVTVNGVLAPLFLVRPNQINIQVPFATTGPLATIIVNSNGTPSNSVQVAVASSSPGIFSVNANGLGPGVITHLNNTLVTSQNPAARNEFVVIYLTGLGAVSPPVADGVGGPAAEPLSRAIDDQIQVLFGGDQIPGEIQYAGIAPNFVGLYQINVRIPNDARVLGASVPILLRTATADSDFVDISIGF